MQEAALTFTFFLFTLATVGAVLLLLRWRARSLPDALDTTPALLRSMLLIGGLAPAPRHEARSLRDRLVTAGYRAPLAATVFHGARAASALALGLAAGWAALLVRESLPFAGLAFLCGAGFGYLVPDRFLDARVRRRVARLDEALPPALDLLVLSIEAGQSLDSAVQETSRELRQLFPDLSAEFAQVQLELRAGRARAEVLFHLGRRTGSPELRKLATVLIDSDRFGASLGPALRTHARYLRTRRRHTAQETARKLGVKLIFPVFFLIMPAVFVVTLGPAVLRIFDSLKPLLAGQ